jgi:hypothetical protein
MRASIGTRATGPGSDTGPLTRKASPARLVMGGAGRRWLPMVAGRRWLPITGSRPDSRSASRSSVPELGAAPRSRGYGVATAARTASGAGPGQTGPQRPARAGGRCAAGRPQRPAAQRLKGRGLLQGGPPGAPGPLHQRLRGGCGAKADPRDGSRGQGKAGRPCGWRPPRPCSAAA